ncbi:MAG TPA: DUF1549 domain-containing protein, partial [Gemmatales bacterium]|nr:DUF1549 domain-containing protein [Gemmatales bacterium]
IFLLSWLACSPAEALTARSGKALPVADAAAPPDFGRDILPILSDKRFHCHGPDAATRKGNVRLDPREGAFRQHQGRAAIVPGQVEQSELIARIFSEDLDELMPPPESNRNLTEKQKALLKQWIESGARWEPHWAFVPPVRAALPGVQQESWVQQPIDRFILARLEAQGLAPSPPASREAWLRRVTLDLTGLPPTLAELDAFLADTTPVAFEKVVDRLLASPRYGERMASDWLDIARYADTHGYQMDRYRPMWPYRDWVIQAFQKNLPYDQFVTWQLAGDLLPDASQEQILATAFNRLHMQNEEGGIIEEEYRVSYVVDRVNTFGTAFLGMTFDCTRCHDHKYDPFTMKDYYSLFSFFQNIDESGQTSFFTASMPVPTLLLSDAATQKRIAELESAIEATAKSLKHSLQVIAAEEIQQWRESHQHLRVQGLWAYYPFDEMVGNKSPQQLSSKQPAIGHEQPQLQEAVQGNGVLLNGENGFEFPGTGHFSRIDPFTISLWIKPPAATPRAVVLHHSKAPIDAGSRGYELLLEQNRVAFGLHHMWPGNSLKVATQAALPANTWSQVTVTYDGSSKASGLRIYVQGMTQELEVVRDGLYKDITYDGGEPNLALGYRFRDNGFRHGMVDELRVYGRELTPLEVLSLPDPEQAEIIWNKPMEQLTSRERNWVEQYLADRCSPEVTQWRQKLYAQRKEWNQLVKPIPEVMVMKELSQPMPAYILQRGLYDNRGEMVTANTPAILPTMEADLPRNRLGLASWLFTDKHPLTA